MENCQLVLNVPSPQTLANANEAQPTGTVGAKGIVLSAPFVDIHVWRLDHASTRFLDPQRLSWNTRPPRARGLPLVTFTLSNETTAMSTNFSCTSDSLQTFEFACASEACLVDFWQDREEPMLGALLYPASRKEILTRIDSGVSFTVFFHIGAIHYIDLRRNYIAPIDLYL
jgi:hypothetical protein